MKLKWLGHSSFLITSDEGIRVITDPYRSGGLIRYGRIDEGADIVTVSHNHSDHNHISQIRGSPQVIREASFTEVSGIKIKGVASYHDDSRGRWRGTNIIFCFEVNSIRVCHLGDLGHILTEEQLLHIGEVDILLIPAGGLFTIGAEKAVRVCSRLNPKVVIPMHFRNSKCWLPLASEDGFLRRVGRYKKLEVSEVEFKSDSLPPSYEALVLKPAL